ncbi:LamG domain-containing protein [Flammeovirga sp. SubArs3]|uniref:LamG domain-containing protein n=1 Tax=Flammeovirga sp. SubArs3 TaxID=2995316 RepID=UPI00248BE7A8|nr:LamG domain-containing protein [Flammeovirga sp. SubArs3]
MKQHFLFLLIIAFATGCGLNPDQVKTLTPPPTDDARDTINVESEPILPPTDEVEDTTDVEPEPIEGIQLVSPSNAQAHLTFDKEVQLTWTAEKIDLTYEVFLWKSSEEMPEEPLVSGLQDAFFVITDLEENIEYSWLVKGNDEANYLISNPSVFTTSSVSLKSVFERKVMGLSFNNSVEEDDNLYEVEDHNTSFTNDRFGNTNSAFNGSDAIETGTAAIISYHENLNPGNMTVSVWVRPTDLSNVGWIYSMQRWEGFSMKRESDGRIKNMYFHETSNWGAVDFFTDEIEFEQWTNITITVDGLVRKVYYNGEKVDEIEALGPVHFNAGVGSNLIIGAQVENDNTNIQESFNGGIDDFRIFKEAMTDEEVKTFYNYESNYNPYL